MEKYISFKTYGKDDPFSNWNSLNPSGFIYGSDNSNIYTVFSYNYDLKSYPTSISQVSFISAYAKSAPWEDRAELFADLMFRAYKKEYMENGFGVNEKAKKLSLIIRDFFPNSIGASWERWISW